MAEWIYSENLVDGHYFNVIRGDAKPGYPKPRHLSKGCTRYHLGEVRRFIRGELSVQS